MGRDGIAYTVRFDREEQALKLISDMRSLIHHIFEHDMLSTFAKQRQPVMSLAEMALPLPASSKLWLAPDPESWRASYLGRPETILPSRQVFADEELTSDVQANIDKKAAMTMKLCGLASQIWDHNQQVIITSSSTDASDHLWSQARHQKL